MGIRWKSLRLKSDHEQLTQVAHDKRAIGRKSLSLLSTEERPWAIFSSCSGQKSNVSDTLLIKRIALKEEWFAPNVIDSFSPFLCPRVNIYRRSLLNRSFLKSDMSNSITLLCIKEHPWGNRSGRSLQKSSCELFTQGIHDKRATGAVSSILWVNGIFAHKKWMNRSKYRWANSQPCFFALGDFHICSNFVDPKIWKFSISAWKC